MTQPTAAAPALDPSVVTYDVKDGVATLTMNRAAKRNAVNIDLGVGIRDAMLRAAADPEARVIVFTGVEKSFCVGADMSDRGSLAERGHLLQWRFDPTERGDYQTSYGFFPTIPKPIIAMINGATAGVGLTYACFSDIRFAAEDAIFTTAFVRRGVTGEFGMAWILTRLIGHTHASELLLSGRRFDAAEAKQMGLVSRVYPRAELAEATHAYAREMAQWCSPISMKTHKRELWEAPLTSLAEANQLFKANNQICLATGDPAEGAASFLEKRPPRFKPL
jgi:enoyl-CoA hydratase/carnithine racemase